MTNQQPTPKRTVDINGVPTPFDYHGCIEPKFAARFGYRLIHTGNHFKDENGQTIECDPRRCAIFNFYVKTN